MASRPQEISLTPGSLNLLAPVDRIPEDDCLQLDGWWPGSTGKLEQAFGFALKTYGNDTGPATTIDSMLQVGGKFYFAAAHNGKLWRSGTSSPIDTGYDTVPLGMTASQNYAWVMNRNKQRKDDGTNLWNWTTETPDFSIGPVTPTTVAAAGTPLLAGDYDVYVTYENVDGHQGNPSTKTTVTIAGGDKITVNRPTRVEAAVTGWNIYIQSPGMALPYLINQNVKLYATTTYDYLGTVGLQDDESVIAFDVPLAMDHDPAPAASVAASALFNSRIVVANTAAHTNRIFWTNASEPSYFPGSDGSPEGNWLDIGEDDGDPVLAITVRPGLLMIYRRRSIWRHLGDFDDPNAKVEPVVPEMGTVGVRGVVATAIGDFFVSDEGIYRQNDWPVKVSQKIEPLFLGLNRLPYGGVVSDYRDKSALGFSNGRLVFSYVATGSTTASQTMILHAESGRWFGAFGGFGCFLNAGNNTAELDAGAGASQVFALDSGRLAGGSGMIIGYQSGYFDCNLPDHEKTWPDVVIPHNTRGQDWTVKALVNKGAASYTIATLNSGALTRQVVALVYPSGPLAGQPIRAFNLAIQITGFGAIADPPAMIEGPIILHWYDRPRQAKVFDSGETDLGIQGYKTIDQMEVDIDVPAANLWALEIWSDIAGSGVARARTLALPVTVGRQPVLLTVAPLDGRLYRFLIVPAAGHTPGPSDTFELYGLRARVLPFGVYVNGASADVWDTQPVPIGV